jgi:hypothetical protein
VARFVYNGEGAVNPSLKGHGVVQGFRFHKTDGTNVTHARPTKVGDEIGVEVIDKRVLRHLRHDPRFTEVPAAQLGSLQPPTLRV